MVEIKVPRNKIAQIYAFFFDIIIFGSIVKLVRSIPITPEWIAVVCVCVILMLAVNDYASQYYLLNKEGLHQHFWFYTNHIAWNEFSEIYIQPDELGPKGTKVVCFDKGIEQHISQRADVGRHPFRFHVIRLESPNPETRKKQLEENKSLVRESELLALFDAAGVIVSYKY